PSNNANKLILYYTRLRRICRLLLLADNTSNDVILTNRLGTDPYARCCETTAREIIPIFLLDCCRRAYVTTLFVICVLLLHIKILLMKEYSLVHLDNGIRLLLHRQHSPITHCCMIVQSGSRLEEEGNFGVAHFIEHLLFKRTERRSTHQILNRLEQVGGDLNAYTTKEYTCIHASFLKPHLERALDLFEDVLFHSTFPESEMEKEKS